MNKIFHTVTAAFVIIVLLLGMTPDLPPKPVYAMSGSGTPQDPYIIGSAQDLQNIKLNRSAFYALGGNIDCSETSTWNNGEGFAPIGGWNSPQGDCHGPHGDWNTEFTGGLDGNNYTISNLHMNRPNDFDCQSIFSCCENAIIKNLTLQNFNIHGSRAATLCGSFLFGTINNVHVVNANVTGGGSCDGLCCDIPGASCTFTVTEISNCTIDSNTIVSGTECGGMFDYVGSLCYIHDCTSSAHVVVSSSESTGGAGGVFCRNSGRGDFERCVASGRIDIVGDIGTAGGFTAYNGGTIRECYSTSTVQMTEAEFQGTGGGFVGVNYGDIGNCYSRGSVISTGGGNLGGFVGTENRGGEPGHGFIHECYSAGMVSTSGRIGGFIASFAWEEYTEIGRYYGDGYVANCFWDTETTGTTVSVGGTRKSTAEMKTKDTFTANNWDFTGIWDIDGVQNDGYPFLRTEAVDTPVVSNASGATGIMANSAGLLGDINHLGIDRPTIHIYWGDNDGGTDPASWDNDMDLGIGRLGFFSTEISDLTPSTTYYYRCFAQNSAGSSWAGSSSSFTTIIASAPTVTNLSPTNIYENYAQLNGELTSVGGEYPTVRIYWGDNDGGTDPASWDNDIDLGIWGLEPFYVEIYDLTPSTTYYYRCFAQNSGGSAWAPTTSSFVAGVAELYITNAEPTDISINSARLNGELISTGGENPDVHIYWGDSDGGTDPAGWDNDLDVGTLEPGPFYADIDGLNPDTTYYYRCFAQNSMGSSWGYGASSFITVVVAPSVANNSATSITATSARLNGELATGGAENPTVHIYWGDNDGGTDPAKWDNDVDLGSLEPGQFYTDITGLTPYTQYYYRCFTQNSAGSNWAFTTAGFRTAALPTVTNTGASYITLTSARLNGKVTATEGENPTVHIYWGDNDGGTDAASWDNDINLGTLGLGTLYADIAGLIPNTKYYYRCLVQNSNGFYWAAGTPSFVAGTKLIGAEDITPNSYLNQNLLALTRYTADCPGTMTQIKVKCNASGNVKVAIYADSNGQPGNLLSANNNPTLVSAGWNAIDISPVQIILGTDYWLAFISNSRCIGYTNSGGQTIYKITFWSDSFSFPASAGTGFNDLPASSLLISGWGIPPLSSSSATEGTSNQSNLTETILEQALITDNITITGDLTGTFAFIDFKMVSIKTGPFANKGFFNTEWQATLEGISYTGSWQGMAFLNQDENRIYLEGNSSGGISGIIEGYLSESAAGSGIYDQFQVDLRLSRVDNKAVSGTISLNGTMSYQTGQEYPATQLYVLQTSLAGTSSGDYSGALDIIITHLGVAENNNPYYGQGFSLISYTSEMGSGTGYTYDQLMTTDQVVLNGTCSSPLLGIVSGLLDESKSPRTLSITIERIDLGAPPKADLRVTLWGPERVSPGQNVTYAIEYNNDGLKPATKAVINFPLNYSVKYASASKNAFYDPCKNEVSWDLGALPPKSHGYLYVITGALWGLAGGKTLDNGVCTIDLPEPQNDCNDSYEDGVYCNGISYNSDNPMDQYIKGSFACAAHVKHVMLYNKTNAITGMLHVICAREEIATPKNGLNNPVLSGYKKKYIGHSGGTMSLTALALQKKIQGDQLILLSPQFVKEGDLIQILADQSFDQIIVYQGDKFLPRGADILALALFWALDPDRDGMINRGQLVALGETVSATDPWYDAKEVIETYETALKGRTHTLYGILPDTLTPGWTVNMMWWDFSMNSYPVTPNIRDMGWILEAINLPNIQHGDYDKVLPWWLDAHDGEFPTKVDESELRALVDEFHKHNLICFDMPGQLITTARDPNFLSVAPTGYIKAGELLTYTIDYENEGEGIAYGVYITDTLEPNLDASSLSINNGGIYDPQTRTINWFIGEVQPGQKGSVTFSINSDINVPDGTGINNFATVYFPSVPEETRTNGVVSMVWSHPQHITVETVSSPITDEGGSTATLAIVLTYQPAADVTINLSSDDPSEGTVSPSSVTFTQSNWDQPQMVTVTGVGDNEVDDDIVYHIITAPAVSVDPGYNGLDPNDITLVNINMTETTTDNVSPITQIQVTPTANENGWHNSDITIDLTAADNEGGSGVKEIHFKLSGTTQVDQTIPADVVSFTIYTEGIIDLTYYSVDNAGNKEAEQSVTLRLDKTAPIVSITASPNSLWPPNNKMVNVFIGGSANDNLAGIASTTFDVTDEYNTVEPVITNFNTTIKLQSSRQGSDKDGRVYTISATTRDKAGNAATSSTTVICPHDQGK